MLFRFDAVAGTRSWLLRLVRRDRFYAPFLAHSEAIRPEAHHLLPLFLYWNLLCLPKIDCLGALPNDEVNQVVGFSPLLKRKLVVVNLDYIFELATVPTIVRKQK